MKGSSSNGRHVIKNSAERCSAVALLLCACLKAEMMGLRVLGS